MGDWQIVVDKATKAATTWSSSDPSHRASILESIGRGLDENAERLVQIAADETHLGNARLRGELLRTVFQLGLFAKVLREGSAFEATIDHLDDDWGMGPRPDVRRILIPVGPVVVFAASNFPFAFSTVGGDTASATVNA